jgi:hypothetical protein
VIRDPTSELYASAVVWFTKAVKGKVLHARKDCSAMKGKGDIAILLPTSIFCHICSLPGLMAPAKTLLTSTQRIDFCSQVVHSSECDGKGKANLALFRLPSRRLPLLPQVLLLLLKAPVHPLLFRPIRMKRRQRDMAQERCLNASDCLWIRWIME